eukprot:m.183482 g.183482  ORF g.183482 m.183482 type:complete len:176 (-) comp16652_c1_seq2:2060-2587(-)
MSFVWRLMEALMLVEVVFAVILCVPLTVWRKFMMGLIPLFRTHAMKRVLHICEVLFGILFIDAMNGVYRTPHTQYFPDSPHGLPSGGPDHTHVRLLRAERNAHIAGFCLLLLFLIDRLMSFIVEVEDNRKKLAEREEQVQLLSDQLQARAATVATARSQQRDDEALRHRRTAAAE